MCYQSEESGQFSTAGRALWQEYLGVSNDRRRTIRPGDKLPLTRIEFTFIGAHRQLVDSLEPRPPNRFCADADVPPADLGENGHRCQATSSLTH